MRSGFPAGNPIANILVVIAGAVLIGASIVLGFFAFLVLSAIVLVSAAVFRLRVWWLNRKGPHGQTTAGRSTNNAGGVIEGEYRVLDRDRDEP